MSKTLKVIVWDKEITLNLDRIAKRPKGAHAAVMQIVVNDEKTRTSSAITRYICVDRDAAITIEDGGRL